MAKATEKPTPTEKPSRRKQALDAIDFTSDREMMTSQQSADETPEAAPAEVAAPAAAPEQTDLAGAYATGDETPAEGMTTTVNGSMIFLNVRGCSACGGDHNGVIELPLTAPALDIQATHFFNCPTTGTVVYIKHLE